MRSNDINRDHAEALADLQSLRDKISKAIETTGQRLAAPFDAIQGSPPEWMTEADSLKWLEARRFMLDRFPEADVRAWIDGKVKNVPQMPDDDFGEFAGNLTVLRAAAHLTLKESQRARGEKISRMGAEKISGGYEARLRLFRQKLLAWEQAPQEHRARTFRQTLTANAIALKFAAYPKIYSDPGLPDGMPEETMADYVEEIRRRDREGYKWG